MRLSDLKKVTGKQLKSWYAGLMKDGDGCGSIWYGSTDKYRYCVCMGWHHYDDEPVLDKDGKQVVYGKWNIPKYEPVWKIAWKIGRQTYNNIMQCDLDVDFEMPYVTEKMAEDDPELCEGDVDDTLEVVECLKRPNRHGDFPYSAPDGYRSWDALAAHIRKTARRVFRDWKDHDE